MRALALAFFWACAFGGLAWAAARWAGTTVRRHVNEGLDPSRYADLEFFAPSGAAVVAEAERITRQAAT